MKIQNTFGIDAQCRRYLEYATVEKACAVADELRSENQPFLIVGAGSNLLPTGDYTGTVVHSAIRGITLTEQPDGNALLRCGSGETWDDVVAWTVDRGFADLANLSLIPGEVGASAVQNIGAYGAEACQFIHDIRAIDIQTGQCVIIPQQDCQYGYRAPPKPNNRRRLMATRYTIRQINKALATKSENSNCLYRRRE